MHQHRYVSFLISHFVSTLAISLAVGAFFAYMFSFIIVAITHYSLNPSFILYFYAVSWVFWFMILWAQKHSRTQRRMLKMRMTEQNRRYAWRAVPAQFIPGSTNDDDDDRLEA